MTLWLFVLLCNGMQAPVMNWQSSADCQWEQKPGGLLLVQEFPLWNLATQRVGRRDGRHIFTFISIRGLDCFSFFEILLSVWFTRRTLPISHCSVCKKVRGGRWQLTSTCLMGLVAKVTELLPPDTSWWCRSFTVGRQMAAALSPCGPCCVNCHLEANEPAKRRAEKSTGSEAVEQSPKRELQKKKKPTLREGTSQTDIPQHLNFPGQLYLNETSHSKSVKAISRRTEEYFNHDTKHWIAFWCDTLPLRRYYSCQWDWYVSIC